MDKLSDLPPLREVIQKHNLRAEKSLGQNFILDQNLTDKIVRTAGNISNYHIIEIGPGPGGLTRSIIKASPEHLTAIEFDPRAINALQDVVQASQGHLSLLHADALETDVTQIGSDLHRGIIANLPYNIATPLLINWLRQIRKNKDSIQLMHLMFQKEVAERITAKPSTKAYGRLAIISQWLCDVSIAMDLPPSAFVPPPKVTSSVVHFQPKVHDDLQPSFNAVEKITSAAFQQRRKMIRSSLKPYALLLEQAELDGTLRAEDLSVEDYIRLATLIDQEESH